MQTLALQLFDHDIVLINNHLGIVRHHFLINVAFLQHLSFQTSRVKAEHKEVDLALIKDGLHDHQAFVLLLLDTWS